jgi:hypothetical protein
VSEEGNLDNRIKQLQHDVTFELQRRERPDRHPYQVGCLSGLLIVSAFQILLGLPPESALFEVVERSTLIALNTPFIIGSVLTLYGAYLDRNTHFVASVRLGIWGHLSTFVATMTYSSAVIVATGLGLGKPYWLGVTSVGLSIGLSYASIARFIQMRNLLKDYRGTTDCKEQR